MSYTSHHLYSDPDLTVAGAEAKRDLAASSDAEAIHEADVWLRSSRVLARFNGDAQPVAELVLRDGREVGRVSLG